MEDMIAPEKSPLPKRKRWKWLVGLALFLLGVIAALPYVASSMRARDWLLAKANAALSPGRLEIQEFRFSWFRPTEIRGMTIFDPQGKTVVDSRIVHWSRNLIGIVFDQPRYGTLRLEDAVLDIERHEDGSIDLVQALEPILVGTPQTEFVIELVGNVVLRSPELVKPIRADRFTLEIQRPAAPGSLTWNAEFARSKSAETLLISGHFNKWDGQPDDQHTMLIDLKAENWPVSVGRGGISTETRLKGDLRWSRLVHGWVVETEGGMKLQDLVIAGEKLNGECVELGDAELGWNYRWSLEPSETFKELAEAKRRPNVVPVKAVGGGKNFREQQFVFDSKSAKILCTDILGPIPTIEASFELAPIASSLPRTLRLREDLTIEGGTAKLSIESKQIAENRSWSASVTIDGLRGKAAETALIQHAPIVLRGDLSQMGEHFRVESLALESRFLKASGKGTLDSGIHVEGSLDLGGMTEEIADFVDLGDMTLEGQGTFSTEIRADNTRVVATGKTSLRDLKIGPKAEPLLVGALNLEFSGTGPEGLPSADWRWSGSAGIDGLTRLGMVLQTSKFTIDQRNDGTIAIGPIEGTLNGGTLHLLPELTLGESPLLRLKSGSTLKNAQVTEESSRRVLTFVAPILDGASVNQGSISARIDRAEFPLTRDSKTKTQVEGQVIFQDLEFTPGPITSELLSLIGRNDPTIRLDQPVVLAITDGRIHQTGLALPVGKLTRIAIEGEVGFDKSLDLIATIPITPEMFPGGGLVGELVAGAQIRVPITGTLSRPRIDRAAFKEEMSRVGRGIGMRAATRGAAELLFRMARPRDPNAPAPLTPAERKAMRQERKIQKRGAG